MSSAAERGLPELVEDSRIDAIVHENITTHKSRFSRRGGPALEKWLNVQLLGHGGDGVVTLERRIEPSEPNQLRAVKRIRIDKGLSTQNHHHRRYIRELEALAKFSQEKYSDSFVAFYGWYTCSQWLYISMEYCEDLDLGRYLRIYECLPEEQVKEITYQLLVGLVFMHESGFAHRDLKPANILIKSKPPEDWWVKLGDLGLSRRTSDAPGSTTLRGTPGFMAPETMGDPFDGDPASADPFSADMWCLGTTVARALTNHAIFNSTLTLRQYQKNMIKFPIEVLVEARLSSEGTVFVSSLMAANPLARPSAAEAIEHLWLTPASDSTHVIVGKDLGTVKGTQASEDWTMGEWTTTVPFESYAQDPFASLASATNKPRVQPHTIVTSREPRPRSPQAETSELPWATEYLELARFHPSFSGGANVPLNPVWEKFLNDGRDELNFDATRNASSRLKSHFATSSDFEEPEPIVDHETEALGKWTTTVSVHSDGHEPNSGPASTVLKSGYQPQTSNEAMMHFLRRVDAVEKASEAATVGLRSFINPDEVQNTPHMTISIEPNSTPRR